jgi:hypothetical protein
MIAGSSPARNARRFSPGPTLHGEPGHAVAVLGFLPAQHGGEPFQIVPALGGNLFANPPDVFKDFVFHSCIIA